MILPPADQLKATKPKEADIPNTNRVGNSMFNQTNFGCIEIVWNQQPIKVSFKKSLMATAMNSSTTADILLIFNHFYTL